MLPADRETRALLIRDTHIIDWASCIDLLGGGAHPNCASARSTATTSTRKQSLSFPDAPHSYTDKKRREDRTRMPKKTLAELTIPVTCSFFSFLRFPSDLGVHIYSRSSKKWRQARFQLFCNFAARMVGFKKLGEINIRG